MSDDLDRDLKARFDRELARVRPPATWSLAKRRSSPLGVAVTVAVVAAMLVGATVGGLALRQARESQSAAVPSASPSPSRNGSARVTPSPILTSPAGGPVMHENAILGYRITLPEGYRRYISRLESGQEGLGVDAYTLRTERQEREQCLRDGGDVGFPRSPDDDPEVVIGVVRNVRGVSAVEWATTAPPGSQPRSTHQRVETVTIGGHEAVRLVADNATAVTNAFVIRANDRIYDIHLSQGLRSGLPKTWLDEIARTFVAVPPTAFPTPTATTPPRVAARNLAEALARAFAARDADAVARLMPACWINVTAQIDGQATGGVLYRSITLFTETLRDRFAKGDLSVTIDPTVQVDREELFVRSEWREPDRTTRIDLYLSTRDGRTEWFIARHHYARGDMLPGSCIPYRSPWTSGTGSC